MSKKNTNRQNDAPRLIQNTARFKKIFLSVITVLSLIFVALIVLLILDGTGILYDYEGKEYVIEAPEIKSETVITSGMYQYIDLADGTVSLLNCAGVDDLETVPSSLEIPAELDGKKVSAISDFCFLLLNENIREIKLPEGITYIGENAFFGITNAHIYLPSTLTAIQKNAFAPFIADDGEKYYVEKIYYAGSQSDWENVRVGGGNTVLSRVIFEQ